MDKKRGALTTMLAMSLMMADSLPDINHPLGTIDKPKKYKCKKCGKEFYPISENKKVYCSVECFKTRNASQNSA